MTEAPGHIKCAPIKNDKFNILVNLIFSFEICFVVFTPYTKFRRADVKRKTHYRASLSFFYKKI